MGTIDEGGPGVRQLGAGGCMEWINRRQSLISAATFKPRRLQSTAVVDMLLNRTELNIWMSLGFSWMGSHTVSHQHRTSDECCRSWLSISNIQIKNHDQPSKVYSNHRSHFRSKRVGDVSCDRMSSTLQPFESTVRPNDEPVIDERPVFVHHIYNLPTSGTCVQPEPATCSSLHIPRFLNF